MVTGTYSSIHQRGIEPLPLAHHKYFSTGMKDKRDNRFNIRVHAAWNLRRRQVLQPPDV